MGVLDVRAQLVRAALEIRVGTDAAAAAAAHAEHGENTGEDPVRKGVGVGSVFEVEVLGLQDVGYEASQSDGLQWCGGTSNSVDLVRRPRLHIQKPTMLHSRAKALGPPTSDSNLSLGSVSRQWS